MQKCALLLIMYVGFSGECFSSSSKERGITEGAGPIIHRCHGGLVVWCEYIPVPVLLRV